MYAFCVLIRSSMKFIDCLLFGAIISATDPGVLLPFFLIVLLSFEYIYVTFAVLIHSGFMCPLESSSDNL